MKNLYKFIILFGVIALLDRVTVNHYKSILKENQYYSDLCMMVVLNEELATKMLNIGLDKELKKRDINFIEATYIKRSVNESISECGE